MSDDPNQIGNGILFLFVFSAIIILFLSIGNAINTGVTQPVEITGEIHSHNSSNSSEIIQMDHVRQGCIKESFQAYNPDNASFLEQGLQFRVKSYRDCTVNVTNYKNDRVAFSYSYKALDNGSTASVGILTKIAKAFVYGIMPISMIVIFILFSPRMIKYVRRGGQSA